MVEFSAKPPSPSPVRGSPVDPRGAAEVLFGSPTLVDLLEIFCRNPSRAYYVNELIKLSGRFPRSVQLALARLTAAGIVQVERQANAKFYRVVADHPFYPQLAAIAEKIPDTLDLLRAELAPLHAAGLVQVAFLRAGEDGSPELDLVVVGRGERTEVERRLDRLVERLGRPVHLSYFSVADWVREARRSRSFVRWLLEEARTYLVGTAADLPSSVPSSG